MRASSATRPGSWLVGHVAAKVDPRLFRWSRGQVTITGVLNLRADSRSRIPLPGSAIGVDATQRDAPRRDQQRPALVRAMPQMRTDERRTTCDTPVVRLVAR